MFLTITCSIVLYNNPRQLLKETIKSFLNTNLDVKLYLIDNSPTDELRDIWFDERIEYIFNNSNIGFGSGHNIAIKKAVKITNYHLILNPDIYYGCSVVEELLNYLETNTKTGLITPKIIYPDGKMQYLTKLIPSPLDFIIRRIIPFKGLKKKLTKKFELRFTNYDTIIEAPYLSGCFMIFRTDVLKIIDGFDENIFMHMEDLDITRRVWNAGYKTIFYPKVLVIHDHEIKKMTNFKTLLIYLKSAVYYFNKWGWIFDKNRREINRYTLKKIESNKL